MYISTILLLGLAVLLTIINHHGQANPADVHVHLHGLGKMKTNKEDGLGKINTIKEDGLGKMDENEEQLERRDRDAPRNRWGGNLKNRIFPSM